MICEEIAVSLQSFVRTISMALVLPSDTNSDDDLIKCEVYFMCFQCKFHRSYSPGFAFCMGHFFLHATLISESQFLFYI